MFEICIDNGERFCSYVRVGLGETLSVAEVRAMKLDDTSAPVSRARASIHPSPPAPGRLAAENITS